MQAYDGGSRLMMHRLLLYLTLRMIFCVNEVSSPSCDRHARHPIDAGLEPLAFLASPTSLSCRHRLKVAFWQGLDREPGAKLCLKL